MRPLPAIQLFTATLILGSTGWTIFRMNWVRTCSWARQVALLAWWWRWLPISITMACRRERLPICAVHGWRLSHAPPDGVCRNKSLRLGRDRREDAVLVEPHAIGASAVFGGLEARAAYLCCVSRQVWGSCVKWVVPCGVCSSDRRWQCAGAELEAGGAAAHTAVVVVAARMDPGVDRGATHWDPGGGTVAAGTEDVGGQPCLGVAPGLVVEGEGRPSEVRCSVSEVSRILDMRLDAPRALGRAGIGNQADLHGQRDGRHRWQAAARSAAANGRGAGPGRPGGEETWCWGKEWLTSCLIEIHPRSVQLSRRHEPVQRTKAASDETSSGEAGGALGRG